MNLSIIANHILNKNFYKAMELLPTDIIYLKNIFKIYKDQTPELILCWLNILLMNPFDLNTFLSNKEILDIKSFLNDYFKNIHSENLNKILFRVIALLLSNLFKNKDEIIVIFEKSIFYIDIFKMNEIEFYKLSCQIIKIEKNIKIKIKNKKYIQNNKEEIESIKTKIEDNIQFETKIEEIESIKTSKEYIINLKILNFNEIFTDINENDSMIIKRYKLKIRSYKTTEITALENFNYFMKFINYNFLAFGWTLSKCIFRICKYLNQEKIINELKNMMKNEIFGDEQMWINNMSIFSMFVLNNNIIGNIDFLKNILVYDKEFNYRCINIRETGLFLLWCIIRSGLYQYNSNINDINILKDKCKIYQHDNNKNYIRTILTEKDIYTVIGMVLFDKEYRCRRASISVIHEFIGRNIKIKNENNDFQILLEIDQNSVKRNEECYKIFKKLKKKELLEEFIQKMVIDYDKKTREKGAIILANEYNYKIYFNDNNLCNIDGNFRYIYYWNKNRNDKKEYKGKFKCNKYYKLKKGRECIESYLKIYKNVEKVELKENLIFLIKNNIKIKKLSKIILWIKNDFNFCNEVFKILKKNECSLIANSGNIKYIKEYLNYCEICLKENKFIITVIESVENVIKIINDKNNEIIIKKEIEESIKNINKLIKECLNDYKISFNGDSGYFIRKKAFFYFFNYFIFLRSYNSTINLFNYLVRFIVDKSKRLREEIIYFLLENGFYNYKNNFNNYKINELCKINNCYECYEQNTNCKCKINIVFGLYCDLIEEFFKNYQKFLQIMSEEEAHFKAAFNVFSRNIYFSDDFYFGIINTISVSDFTISRFIIELFDSDFILLINFIKKISNKLILKTQIINFVMVLKKLNYINLSNEIIANIDINKFNN